MINTRPSANYTPPLRSERQPMILRRVISQRAIRTDRDCDRSIPAGHQNLASATDRAAPTLRHRHFDDRQGRFDDHCDGRATSAALPHPHGALPLPLPLPFPFFSSATRFFLFVLERLP